MKCRPSIYKYKVIGIEIKAESRQDREVLRRLCQEYPKILIVTDDDYNFVRIPFEEFKDIPADFKGE